MKRGKIERGFSLIELLVVVSLLAILAVLFSSSFVAIMAGSNKAQVTSEVKQNGEYALTTINQLIRRAKYTPMCAADGKSVDITAFDDSVVTISCDYTDAANGNIKRIARGNNLGAYVYLTDTLVKVVDGSCKISCSTAPASPPGVSIEFILIQNSGSTNLRPWEQTSQKFSTTTYQRNY